jgi:hypothetical protein
MRDVRQHLLEKRVSTIGIHQCKCKSCHRKANSPLKEHHRLMNFFSSLLDNQQRRLYAAIESKRLGHGGPTLLSRITGISPTAIARGRKELEEYLLTGAINQEKDPGGRPGIEKKFPNIKAILEQVLDAEIAGDPIKQQKWIRSSLTQLAQRLKEQDVNVSRSTVWRLLKGMGFSMRVNIKKKRGFGSDSKNRDEQFKYIASMRQEFSAASFPIISVDTKKKELIGDFKKSGKAWCKEALEVNEYDFPSLATCRAVPYGIYDITKNRGFVYVGTSGDTPEFAVDTIARWWKTEGSTVYPGRVNLLILADGGGSNGCRVRAWKQQLQEKVCDKLRVSVTVCHYPTRCSKWNPIERRLFSQISLNWAGRPLRTIEMMLGYIRGTSTGTGLTVKAFLQDGSYKQGQKVSKKEMDQLNLEPHTVCPNWNYTIRPR